MFQVINSRTKEVIANRKTRTSARRLVDRLDNQYGGYIHTIRNTDDITTTPNQMFREQRESDMGQAVREALKGQVKQ